MSFSPLRKRRVREEFQLSLQDLQNKDRLKIRRRELRNNATAPESLLWSRVRRKRLGCVCKRQYSIGCYIVDFYIFQKLN